MPPTNSPENDTSEIASASPYLEQLRELASPVPNFAATLTTPAEREAEEENVSFLRAPSPYPDDTITEQVRTRRSSYLTSDEFESMASESQRRMRRAVFNQRRYTPAQLQDLADPLEHGGFEGPPLSETVYNGWAPGSSDAEDEMPPLGPEFQANSRGEIDYEGAIRRYRQGLSAAVEEARSLRPGARAAEHSSQRGQSHFIENGIGAEPTTTQSSLRTAALLQSVRRHPRFSVRSRNQLQNLILDRDRTLEDRAEFMRAHPDALESDHEIHLARQRELRARMHAMQQARAEASNVEPPCPEVTRWLEEAIKYLGRVRFCDSHQERVSYAQAGGFPEKFFTSNHQDFIMDTTTIDPPPETSWLKPGGVFFGSQHATGGSQSLAAHSIRLASENREPRNLYHRRNTRPPERQGPWPNNIIRPTDSEERWPVKVTINDIDYDSMTLCGTMEAFNVPDKSAPNKQSSITTFLQGEIIDFNKFALQTKSFKADARIDGTYWRKLEPFKDLSEKEIVQCLVSRKWVTEELATKWILMRWKEKCFITPSDAQSGLTISGFYYVSLRREDGHVEGLYYDPSSTPYQHLSLMPQKRTFPAFAFR